MDGKRFDDLSRRFATRQSRRGFLALIGVATTGALTRLETEAAPKKEKPTKCYGEGSHCTNGKQCCSNTCTNRQCAAAVPTCTSSADCAGTDTECQTRTCVNGICGVEYAPYEWPVSEQIPGDCQRNVCDGSGGVTSIADDSDLPEVADECLYGTCSEGEPGTGNWEAGRPCLSNGGFECDGNGQCVVCLPGAITSCYSGPEGTIDVGVCRSGTMTCLEDGSGFGECFGEVLPSPEQCNLLDDDCDGLVDEGVAGVGAPCSSGLPGICAQGTMQCQNGTLRCVPNVLPGSRPEVCNGLDDNCDGLVDVGACPGTQECIFSEGSYRCCIPGGESAQGNCNQCCSGVCLGIFGTCV